MSSESFTHQSVLLNEVASVFQNRKIRIFVDGTLGCGGHAEVLLDQHRQAFYIGMDVDKDMIKEAKKRLRPYQDRVKIYHENFIHLDKVLKDNNISGIDGFLLDLGVSSRQLDFPERGFSFRFDAKLDMRLDPSHGETAFDLINREQEKKLEEILFHFGEEKDAAKISAAIVDYRKRKEILTTQELDKIVRQAKGRYHYKKNPSAKVFQAFRIYLNKELENLEKVLPMAVKALKPQGRMAVISFHSLEDRIVKSFFRSYSATCSCLEDLPVCRCSTKPFLSVLKRGAFKPGRDEKEKNPRSRSARLRAAEKIGDGSIED